MINKKSWIFFDKTFCSNGESCPNARYCERLMTKEEKNTASKILLSFSPFYDKTKDKCNFFIKRR